MVSQKRISKKHTHHRNRARQSAARELAAHEGITYQQALQALEEGRLTAKQPRYRATFVAQVWNNDYAVRVDPGCPVQWDITPAYLEKMLRLYGPEVLENYNYSSDELRYDPAAPEWVREWQGPFEVEVKEIV